MGEYKSAYKKGGKAVKASEDAAASNTSGIVRKDVEVGLLVPQEINPNEMTAKEFNLLVDNIQRVGFTDPVLVRPHPTEKGKYRIVGGTHRWEAAKVLEMKTVPVSVITNPDFDDDQERFQIVRHNIIKGSMSAQKFLDLYKSLNAKYEDDIAAELFGFAEAEEFKSMIQATAKSLPKEMQAEFKEAAKDIKSIDDLANLLNRLFSKFGDTLPYGYMFLDFGGKDSIWLRMQPKDKDHFIEFGAQCKDKSITVDSAMACLLQLIATDGSVLKELFEKKAAKLTKVVIPDEVEMPSLDYLDQVVHGPKKDFSDKL
jgi:ParB/RepB/Spo0J family partition protein